jgi:chromosome segregation ATPase
MAERDEESIVISKLMDSLGEIQKSLNEISSSLNEIRVDMGKHEMRIGNLERNCGEINREVRGISNTCIERKDAFTWMKELRESGKADPESFWNKLVVNGVISVLAPITGCLISFWLGKIVQ